MRSARRAPAIAPWVVLAFAAGCTTGETGGAIGLNNKLRFRAQSDLVFSATVVAGSTFSVRASSAADDSDVKASLKGAVFSASDNDVLTVDVSSLSAGHVTFKKAGTVELQVTRSGTVIDSIVLKAAVPAATVLVDTLLLATTDGIDARLPQQFALIKGRQTDLSVAAVDNCAGELLDIGASTLTTTGVEATVTSGAVAGFVVDAPAVGDLVVVLHTPGLPELSHDVSVVDTGDVDEVHAEVSAVTETTAAMWARAFSNDREVIGGLTFTFTSSPRVTLDPRNDRGALATISFAAAGEPADDRPATATAEVFGESGSVDFLTLLQADLKQSMGTPARVAPDPKATAPSCQGDSGGTCAAGLCALRSLSRLRKRRV